MSFPRYESYKDSGVEWLGDVPEHWDVRRLKEVCEVFPSNVDKKTYENETPVLLCNYTDVYYNEKITPHIDFMAATASADQIKKFTLRGGDTIITKDSETADDIAIAAYVPQDLPNVICGYHLSMIRPREATCGAFIKRLFDSIYVKSCCAVYANGLTRVGLGQYALDNLEMPFPPKTEQAAIAAFLNRETAKIDALIAEQQRLIELLKEKRQSVISHAVTKGLNPNAPMKDSGIECLGKVPEHWEVCALRRLLSVPLANGIFKKKDDFGDGVLLVNVFDVYQNDFKIKFEQLDRVKCSPDEAITYQVLPEDLFFVRSSLKQEGIAAVVVAGISAEEVVFECHLIRARPKQSTVNSRYCSYLLNSPIYRAKMIAKAKITTMTTIDQETILSTILPQPPKEEQQTIAAFLDRETAKLDTFTAEAKTAITLLQERRTALISAAVTGKIDVRGAGLS
jgi:type I restriction enzyme S subunit